MKIKAIGEKGFSLIELIIFMVIVGIGATGIIAVYQFSLSNTSKIEYNNQAIALAQERMAIILGFKKILGFSSFYDPCEAGSPPAICGSKAGYTVSSTITSNWFSNSNFKRITVTVSGLGNATMTTMVANY